MSAPLVLIAGGGGVLGAALADEFTAAGHAVVALRRQACDLSDAAQVERAAAQAVRDFGPAQVLVCNAAYRPMGGLLTLQPSDFEAAWRASMASALGCLRAVLPGMVAQGRGCVLFTGATASLRGGAGFAAFASAKFALRGLAQAVAREFHPQGVHVAHVVLDGLLSGSASDTGRADTLDPAAVARSYRWLAEQERSAWVHELDLRPQAERF